MRYHVKLALLASAAAYGLPAYAQEAPASPEATVPPAVPDAAAGDIIVTAQKRATSLQQTPLAVSAVGGQELRTRQIRDIEDLAPSLPNVNFGKNVGIARIAIRGLGFDSTLAGQEGRVAYHLDGVYVSRPAATLGTFFDIDRVEVVRGPQGTLYGRNATAGAVNVITADPESQFGGYARFTVGNYSTFIEEAALTGPVNDAISARVAAIKTDRGGFGKNVVTGQEVDNEHSLAVRAKLKIEPNASTKLTLEADYYHRDDGAFVYHFLGAGNPLVPPTATALGATKPANPRDTNAKVPQGDVRSFAGLTGTAEFDLGLAKLTSITAYRDGFYRVTIDGDDTNAAVGQTLSAERSHQISEELRLAGSLGRLNWIVGGYYFRERIFGETRLSPVRSPVPALRGAQVFGLNFDGHMRTDAYAAFGQLDYEILPRLTLSAGVRYSHEKKAIDQRTATEFVRVYDPGQQPNYTGFQDEATTFSDTTPRFGIEYKPNNNILIYATYAKGFKSGTYNLTSVAPPVQPEQLTDYEAGIKLQLLDRRLTVNLAAFKYDYTNLQVTVIRGTVAVLENAATARLKGLEGEIVAKPFENFEISGSGAYLSSRFTRYATIDGGRPELGVLNLAGNQLPQAPRWTGNAAIQYRIPVGSNRLTLRGELTYSSRVYFSAVNRPEISQGANSKTNAIIRYELANGLNASAFIRNIGNRRTVSSSQVSSSFAGYPIMGTYDPPRTYGLTLGYNF